MLDRYPLDRVSNPLSFAQKPLGGRKNSFHVCGKIVEKMLHSSSSFIQLLRTTVSVAQTFDLVTDRQGLVPDRKFAVKDVLFRLPSSAP